MAPRTRRTAGVAESKDLTAAGTVTKEELDKARNTPEISAAVTALKPFSTGIGALVAQLQVRNEMEYLVMADLLRQAKTAITLVDSKFDPITKPLWAAFKAATTWRGEVRGPLELAEETAKQKIGEYQLNVERLKREVADQQRAAQLAQRQAERVAEWSGVGGGATPTHSTGHPTPVTLPQPPAPGWATTHPAPPQTPPVPQFQPLFQRALQPVQAQGVGVRLQWTVEITDERAAVLYMIRSGLVDLSILGVGDLFLRLDHSALKIAIKGDGEPASTVRLILAQVPGITVTQTTTTTARGYE